MTYPDIWGSSDDPRDAWPRRHLTVEETSRTYPALKQRVAVLLPTLSAEQIALVVSLVTDTCDSCWASNGWCSCGNDE